MQNKIVIGGRDILITKMYNVMRKILIPTDFSDVSKNSLRYGLDLYRRTESIVDLVHIYHPAFDPGQTEIIDVSSGVEKILESKMKDLISTTNIFDLDVKDKVEVGFAIERIIEMSFNYDIIIMGTTGVSGLLGRLFGSVSTEVAEKSHCPVLLVPPNISFGGYKNVIYACDVDGVSNEVLNEIMTFAKRYKAKLHFVHIKDGNKTIEISLPKEIQVDCTVNEIEADSVIKGVNLFIDKKNADLVIIATKQRSFWEGILHANHTKEFVLSTKIPLLVYHDTRK